MAPEQVPGRRVAQRVRERGLPEHPVLGADTEVVLDGEILGKPENAVHGMDMLRRLAGRTHEVLSAVCVWHREKEYTALSTSRVTFRPLTPAEIEQYWKTGALKPWASADSTAGPGMSLNLLNIMRTTNNIHRTVGQLPAGTFFFTCPPASDRVTEP